MPSGPSSNPSRPVCVVLSSPGRSPDDALLKALDRQGLVARPSVSIHGAMAELCQRGGASPKRVLLIADDDARIGAERVMRAARRYAPDAACWIYQPGANPPLRAHVVEEGRPAEPAPEPAPSSGTPERSPTGSPMLRLIAADEPAPVTNGLGEAEEPTAEHVLSTDELTMLLAEEENKGRKR